jgi:hypothetical protein
MSKAGYLCTACVVALIVTAAAVASFYTWDHADSIARGNFREAFEGQPACEGWALSCFCAMLAVL